MLYLETVVYMHLARWAKFCGLSDKAMLGGFQTMKRVYIELQRNFATQPPDDCEDCEYIFQPNIIELL